MSDKVTKPEPLEKGQGGGLRQIQEGQGGGLARRPSSALGGPPPSPGMVKTGGGTAPAPAPPQAPSSQPKGGKE